MIYQQPERIQGAAHTIKSDIWSLGITLIELIVGQFPSFDSDNNSDSECEGERTTPADHRASLPVCCMPFDSPCRQFSPCRYSPHPELNGAYEDAARAPRCKKTAAQQSALSSSCTRSSTSPRLGCLQKNSNLMRKSLSMCVWRRMGSGGWGWRSSS